MHPYSVGFDNQLSPTSNAGIQILDFVHFFFGDCPCPNGKFLDANKTTTSFQRQERLCSKCSGKMYHRQKYRTGITQLDISMESVLQMYGPYFSAQKSISVLKQHWWDGEPRDLRVLLGRVSHWNWNITPWCEARNTAHGKPQMCEVKPRACRFLFSASCTKHWPSGIRTDLYTHSLLAQSFPACAFSFLTFTLCLCLWGCCSEQCSLEMHRPQSESQTHPRWCSPERCSLERHRAQFEWQTHPRWYSPESCSFERRSFQSESQTHPRWCLAESCTHQRHSFQRESQTHPKWCSPESCSFERHGFQSESQTHPRRCSPERCSVQRHRSQSESQTHPKWCSPERCSLEKHESRCESQTHPRWCSPESCSFERHRAQCESQTHPRWCSPERCS